MKRVDGFASGESPGEGWVTVRVKVRPALAEALKAEAQRESQELHRSVYVSDLVRDGIRLLLQARRIKPYGKTKARFVPSSVSEGKD